MKNRVIINEIIFNAEGDFEAYRDAERFAHENGYSIGSMCSPLPTALIKGDYNVAKWKNLTPAQRFVVDGMITSEGYRFREGPVKITIFKPLQP